MLRCDRNVVRCVPCLLAALLCESRASVCLPAVCVRTLSVFCTAAPPIMLPSLSERLDARTLSLRRGAGVPATPTQHCKTLLAVPFFPPLAGTEANSAVSSREDACRPLAHNNCAQEPGRCREEIAPASDGDIMASAQVVRLQKTADAPTQAGRVDTAFGAAVRRSEHGSAWVLVAVWPLAEVTCKAAATARCKRCKTLAGSCSHPLPIHTPYMLQPTPTLKQRIVSEPVNLLG